MLPSNKKKERKEYRRWLVYAYDSAQYHLPKEISLREITKAYPELLHPKCVTRKKDEKSLGECTCAQIKPILIQRNST